MPIASVQPNDIRYVTPTRQDQMLDDEMRSRYASEVTTDGSFTRFALGLSSRLTDLQAYTAAGNVTEGKRIYDELDQGFSMYAKDIARAATIKAKGDRFLSAVQEASLMMMQRVHDGLKVSTPNGETTIGELYGKGGLYQQTRDNELQSQNFSKETLDALKGDNEDLKFTIGLVTDPLLRTVRDGQMSKADERSSYVDLADELAEFAGEDAQDLGWEGVREAVLYVRDHHMTDGTATSFYRTLCDAARERTKRTGDKPSYVVRGLARTFDSMVKRQAGDSETGGVAPSAARFYATAFMNVVANNPEIDFDDFYTQAAFNECASVFASAERAGVPLLPLAQLNGAQVGKALNGYIQARSQGLDAPADNLITGLAQMHQRITTLVTPGWSAALTNARNNPDEARGEAAGVFGARSQSPGLDLATLGLYRAFTKTLAPEIARGVREDVAFRDAVGADVGGLRANIAGELARTMIIPEEAAQGIASVWLSMAGGQDGIVSPVGLERAVAAFATGTSPQDTEETVAARDAAMRWYAANLGPQAPLFESLLGLWDQTLRDPVVGYGGDKDREHLIQTAKQEARKAMYEMSLVGLDPQAYAEENSSVGVYYAVTGYRSPDGKLHRLDELDKAGKPGARAGKLRGMTPVVMRVPGNLNESEQPDEWYTPAGYIPSYGAGAYSDPGRRADFYNAQLILKQYYDAQLEAVRDSEAAALKDRQKSGVY